MGEKDFKKEVHDRAKDFNLINEFNDHLICELFYIIIVKKLVIKK